VGVDRERHDLHCHVVFADRAGEVVKLLAQQRRAADRLADRGLGHFELGEPFPEVLIKPIRRSELI